MATAASALQRRLESRTVFDSIAADEHRPLLFAFGIPWHAGNDLTDRPLSERCAHLECLVGSSRDLSTTCDANERRQEQRTRPGRRAEFPSSARRGVAQAAEEALTVADGTVGRQTCLQLASEIADEALSLRL